MRTPCRVIVTSSSNGISPSRSVTHSSIVSSALTWTVFAVGLAVLAFRRDEGQRFR